MVLEYIRYQVPEEQHHEFEEAYGTASRSLAASEHCMGWELSRCVEESERYILRIEWDSIEGHEQGFRNSPEFADFFQAVRAYVPQVQEMRHYQQTAVLSA